MAFYRIDKTKSLGVQLLNLLERISTDFAQLEVLKKAMDQELTGDGSADAHYIQMAGLFGYQSAVNVADSTGAVAHASFNELGSFVGNGGPSLKQCAGQHRQ